MYLVNFMSSEYEQQRCICSAAKWLYLYYILFWGKKKDVFKYTDIVKTILVVKYLKKADIDWLFGQNFLCLQDTQ